MLIYTRGEELPFKNLDTKKALKWMLEQEDIIIKSTGKVLDTQENI